MSRELREIRNKISVKSLHSCIFLNNFFFIIELNFFFFQAMNPNPYRGLWGGSSCRDSPIQTDRHCSCGVGQCVACDMYIAELEDLLKSSCPNKIAGFFAESIQVNVYIVAFSQKAKLLSK